MLQQKHFQSGLGKLYAIHRNIFTNVYLKYYQKDQNQTNTTKLRGKHLNTGFIY